MERIFAFMVWFLISVLQRTYRFKIYNQDILDELQKNGNNYIIAYWHRDILSFCTLFYRKPHVAMASLSKDGEIISLALEKMSYIVVRGSSSRGGINAMKKFVQHVQKGIPGGITVDGPKGPPQIPKPGVFWMAKMSGLKIVPIFFAPQSYWFFKKSWDNFRFPRPFSSIKVYYGKPLTVSPESSKKEFEDLGKELTIRLNKPNRSF